MIFFRKIASSIFSNVAYAALLASSWKRKTVEANLNVTLERSDRVHQKLYRQMLRNLTRHVGELLFCFDTYKNLPEDTAQYPYKIDGCRYELADGTAPVIEKMRQGGIFLTAHYGNYEASGAWLCALGVPLMASFIPLKPAWLNRLVYEKIRCVKGRPYSINARTPREFLSLLDYHQLFCLLADQDSRIGSALDGTFLGKHVKINPLPDFLLKHRPDTPVFFCWIEERRETRDERKKILHAVEAPRVIQSIVDGPYRKWLEDRIQENPALWYGWTHRRFKSVHPEIYD